MSTAEPWYLPQADEVAVFEAAWAARLPVLLKGPTGCGKTRFVEHMAWRLLGRHGHAMPLHTVACHEDLSATDLVGRYLLQGEDTVWQDGPLTRAVRQGGICYLDEVVEARKDTTVVMHPLTDHRRQLPIDKTGERLTAHPDFLLVMAARLVASGLPELTACRAAIVQALSDDAETLAALDELVRAVVA